MTGMNERIIAIIASLRVEDDRIRVATWFFFEVLHKEDALGSIRRSKPSFYRLPVKVRGGIARARVVVRLAAMVTDDPRSVALSKRQRSALILA